MLRKLSISLMLSAFIATFGFAEGITHTKKEADNFYVIAKGLYTIGENVTKGHETLKGKAGTGFGIDVGYTLPYHFSIEFDASYSQNKFEEDHHEYDAEFLTTALDVVYVYHITHTIRTIAKLGYELEFAKLAHEKEHGHGVVYGAGVEYHLNDNYDLLVEYEGSLIKSVRGPSVYAGVKYTF